MSNPLNGTRPVFVKTVSVLTSVATMLSLSGAAYLAPLAANAAVPSDYGLTEGNTISASGTNDPDVYIVNALGYKRLFLNPVIFSFYGHLGGFANVKSVSAAARDAFPTSGLFRNCETNAQQVWAVEVTGEDVATFHKVTMSGDQAVAEDANFFKKVFCINNNEQNWYTKSAVDYTSLSQVPVYSRVPGSTPTPSYGALSVSLASDNPAAGTLISGAATTDGQAGADLAHFLFTGSGTVTQLTLNRLGVSADATLLNVYLYDGVKRLTDAATVSSGVISFNDAGGLFTVNGSRVISVKADVLYGNSGQTVGVQLSSFNGNATSISGNLFTLATATLATVSAAVSASVTPASDGTPAPASDFVAWSDAVTIGNRYVNMKSIQFKVVGSVAAGDLQNFRLYVDGVQQGSAVAQQDANGYIVFDLSASPVRLETGARTVKVLVDIIGGSSKNFYLSLRQKSDISVFDSQYGVGVLASNVFPVSSTAQTIASGTLSITKTPDSPSGDVVKGASGVTLARFEFKAAGERMKVESLRASNTSVAGGLALRNGSLFADSGAGTPMVQIGSVATLWNDVAGAASASTNAYTEYSLGSSLIVTPGTPRNVEIRADIYDASGTDNTTANQSVRANFAVGSSNVLQMTTLNYLNGPTTAAGVQSGNTLTVKTGTMTAGKYTGYANQSVVAPRANFKLGAYTLTAASSEDVNVNTLTFDAVPAIAASLTNDFSDAYVKVINDAGSVIATTQTKSAFSTTASNSYSVNFLLPKSKTYQIELWGTANTTFDTTGTADVFTSNFDASGVTAGSSTTATATQVTGQTITSASGSLTQANGSISGPRFTTGGSTINAYQFTLTPAFDNFTVEEVYVDLSSQLASSTGAVATLQLKDASTGAILSSAVVNGTTSSASFTGVNLLLPSGTTKTLSVDVVTSSVGVGANDTAGVVTVRLDGVKYRNSAGTYNAVGDTLPLSGLATTNGGGDNVVVKGYPTFTNSAISTTLTGAAQTLFKTVVSATGSQVSWNDITFTVASNSGTIGIATSSYQLWETVNGSTTNLNDVMVGDGNLATYVSDSYNDTSDRIEFSFANERTVAPGIPVTLELRGAATGTLSTGNNVTVQITNPAGTTVTTLNSSNQQKSGASFVWSDQSALTHSTSTNDWFTDGLVKTLADAQTVTK